MHLRCFIAPLLLSQCSSPPLCLQLLDELDTEIEGTSTRLQAAQRKVQYVLDKAGSKGQIAIMLFLIVVLVILVVLAIG